MSQDIINGVFERLASDVLATDAALTARRALRTVAANAAPGDMPSTIAHTLAEQADALVTLTNATYIALRNRVRERATQYGWLVATHVIAPIAKDPATKDDAVVWLTGNRYVPAIRDLPDAERLWGLSNSVPGEFAAETWELFIEGLESRLTELDVYLAQPEYDNALYVVDLARWEHVEDAEGDDLADDWRAIVRHT